MVKSKISVLYHGYTPLNCKSEVNIHKKYILYVGGRKGYKNFIRFVEALAPILVENEGLKLLCTGNKLSQEEKELLLNLKITQKVFQSTVNEIQLMNLYKNSILLVFPSIKEGFGFPILEAWGNECSVALSNTDPFLKIAVDAAEYFDPLNIEDIRQCIGNLLSNEGSRKRLFEMGRNRVKIFT